MIKHVTLARRPLLSALTLLTSVTGCASSQRTVPSVDADVAITRVSVVDVESGRVLRDHTVAIKGDRIV
jgi:hypothetical protein